MSHPTPRARRCADAVAVGALAVAVLAGCLSLPTDGSVQQGLPGPPADGGLELVAPGPTEDADPEDIVEGFLLASSLGLSDDFGRAHEFMTPASASEWDALGGVTIYPSSETVEIEVGTAADGLALPVTVTVPVTATVAANGTYTPAPPGTVQEFEFELVQIVDEQWRISQLDPGVLMSEVTFGTQYRDVSLYFLSSESQPRLVPDMRWVPRSRSTDDAVRALLAGPAEWLAPPAVSSAFPDGTELAIEGIVIEDRVATVALSQEFLSASAVDRAYAHQQLTATLRPLGQVTRVEISVGGTPLSVEEDLAPVAPTPVPVRGPIVVRAGELGQVTGGSVSAIDGAGQVPQSFSGLALPYADGPTIGLVGSSALVALQPDAEPTSLLAPGGALLPPSYDVHGWAWTGPTGPGSNAGQLLVVDPVDGTIAEVAAPDLVGVDVVALRVSREGARLAYAVRTDDSVRLYVAAIARSAAGDPVSVSTGQPIGTPMTVVRDLVWVDEVDLAVLAATPETDMTVLLVGVGGQTAPLPSIEGAIALAAGDGPRELYVSTSDSQLYGRSGNGWRPVVEDVSDPAFAG